MSKKDKVQQPRFLVFTDGACSGNPGPGGWGSIIYDTTEESVVELGGFEDQTTNNKMEITALGKVLKALQSHPGTMRIHTDSKYVIQGITSWVHGWKKKGWKKADGGDVANIKFWQRLDELMTARKDEVEFVYVPGHSGVPGNERCDEIAVAYSKHDYVDLFAGKYSDYPVDLLAAIPVPEEAGPDDSGITKKKPIYLSLLDGKVEQHLTWSECEARVKGRSGAKFKKCESGHQLKETLKLWGF